MYVLSLKCEKCINKIVKKTLTPLGQGLSYSPVKGPQHVGVDDVAYRGHVEQDLGQPGVPLPVQPLRLGLPPVETQHTQHHQAYRAEERIGEVKQDRRACRCLSNCYVSF